MRVAASFIRWSTHWPGFSRPRSLFSAWAAVCARGTSFPLPSTSVCRPACARHYPRQTPTAMPTFAGRGLRRLVGAERLLKQFQVANGHKPELIDAAIHGEHVGTIVFAG